MFKIFSSSKSSKGKRFRSLNAKLPPFWKIAALVLVVMRNYWNTVLKWKIAELRARSFGRIFRNENSPNGIQVFRNENSSQTNAYMHYSDYSYSGLIPNERALNVLSISEVALDSFAWNFEAE